MGDEHEIHLLKAKIAELEIFKLQVENKELQKEVKRWKGHHASVVKIKNRLSKRFGELVQKLKALQKEKGTLEEAAHDDD